ncbi:MAG: TOBE domain-containing protein [Candidatus Eisenbacteria bacterium]|nr:TOBE domain-containing protein [Candidatus Latescibacterota bacterium]MBD3300857.1 TOBE domain-containing protein [Candidatus Eisenbacteria bacterium]
MGPLSAQNRIEGTVARLIDRGGRCLLEVDCAGERIHAAITRRAADQLGVTEGKTVTVLFKAAAIHPVGELRGHDR